MGTKALQTIVREAVKDVIAHGFTQERVNLWLSRMREALRPDATSSALAERSLRVHLTAVFDRAIKAAAPGIPRARMASRFTPEQLKPQMRRQLEQRIAASANLIKLNKEQRIDQTLRRFQGWATSIPLGGSDVASTQQETRHIVKALSSLSFEERRVAIDQGHKMAANINRTIAENGGAIAGMWHSRWRVPGYNYRVDHKHLDQRVLLIRNSWAHDQGLVKGGADDFTDAHEQPAEAPFCRCNYQYLYSLRDIPEDLLTLKGKKAIEKT